MVPAEQHPLHPKMATHTSPDKSYDYEMARVLYSLKRSAFQSWDNLRKYNFEKRTRKVSKSLLEIPAFHLLRLSRCFCLLYIDSRNIWSSAVTSLSPINQSLTSPIDSQNRKPPKRHVPCVCVKKFSSLFMMLSLPPQRCLPSSNWPLQTSLHVSPPINSWSAVNSQCHYFFV